MLNLNHLKHQGRFSLCVVNTSVWMSSDVSPRLSFPADRFSPSWQQLPPNGSMSLSHTTGTRWDHYLETLVVRSRSRVPLPPGERLDCCYDGVSCVVESYKNVFDVLFTASKSRTVESKVKWVHWCFIFHLSHKSSAFCVLFVSGSGIVK